MAFYLGALAGDVGAAPVGLALGGAFIGSFIGSLAPLLLGGAFMLSLAVEPVSAQAASANTAAMIAAINKTASMRGTQEAEPP